MTISAVERLFHMGALAILFLTPGPVWVAISARAPTGGFAAARPLAAPAALRRITLVAGVLLIAAGMVIALM